MITIRITKNHKDGNRYRLKGQEFDVLTWKADELIKLKVAELVKKDIETTMKKEDKETR